MHHHPPQSNFRGGGHVPRGIYPIHPTLALLAACTFLVSSEVVAGDSSSPAVAVAAFSAE